MAQSTASTRLANQRQQTARRRQERAEQRHVQDLQRGQQSADRQGIRRQRSAYIDSVPGLDIRQRYDLHHNQQARANAGQYVEDQHAKRLREFDEALASGSRSVQGHRAAGFMNRAAEAQVRQQEITTNYMPAGIRSQLRSQRAETANTRSLTNARDADTTRQNAIAPLERDRAGLENDMLRNVAPRVADGTVLPPNFRNDVRVPAGLNALDEARAFEATSRGVHHLQAAEDASRPPTPDYSERIRALTAVVNDDGAGRDEKTRARQQLAEIAAIEGLGDWGGSDDIDPSQALAVFEDGNGQHVYQMPDGSYRYADGREYQTADEMLGGLGPN